MGIFDQLKSSANMAAEKAKQVADAAKVGYEQKKATNEAYRNMMETEASRINEEIRVAIESNQSEIGLFGDIKKEELLKFTKEFFERILLPASSVSASKIAMYPNISGNKTINKFIESLTDYSVDETALVYLAIERKQGLLLTDKALYYSIVLPQDSSFFAKGRIPCEKIEKIYFEESGNVYNFKCNDYVLMSFVMSKSVTEDVLGLNNYFESIEKHDFEITDDEVDELIRKKISDKVYEEVKRFFVYDDEKLIYFAWGLDSLTAKDYIFCTNKQIVRVDRELLGATANVRQFYYEDINAASTEQNSSSGDLSGFLLETAITSMMKVCDLKLNVSSTEIKIKNLFKIEADRVVAIYHQYRRLLKEESKQSNVVIQQQVDPMEQIKKLHEMKELGIVTQEEFDAKKKQILGI